jgi:hypothetical protein
LAGTGLDTPAGNSIVAMAAVWVKGSTRQVFVTPTQTKEFYRAQFQ